MERFRRGERLKPVSNSFTVFRTVEAADPQENVYRTLFEKTQVAFPANRIIAPVTATVIERSKAPESNRDWNAFYRNFPRPDMTFLGFRWGKLSVDLDAGPEFKKRIEDAGATGDDAEFMALIPRLKLKLAFSLPLGLNTDPLENTFIGRELVAGAAGIQRLRRDFSYFVAGQGTLMEREDARDLVVPFSPHLLNGHVHGQFFV